MCILPPVLLTHLQICKPSKFSEGYAVYIENRVYELQKLFFQRKNGSVFAPGYFKFFFNILGIPAFPNDLESCHCGTTEIAEFAKACKDIGIQYIGLCCGNSSNKLRIVAETYGRRPPASKFSPDLSQNFYLKKLKNTYSDNVEKFQS